VRALGGKTNCWDANTGRCGQYIWKPASYDGFDVDWPIDYDEMAPWNAKVERMIGVSGPDTKNIDFPTGDWLPPIAMRCAEMKIAAAAQKKFGLHGFQRRNALSHVISGDDPRAIIVVDVVTAVTRARNKNLPAQLYDKFFGRVWYERRQCTRGPTFWPGL